MSDRIWIDNELNVYTVEGLGSEHFGISGCKEYQSIESVKQLEAENARLQQDNIDLSEALAKTTREKNSLREAGEALAKEWEEYLKHRGGLFELEELVANWREVCGDR